MKSQPVEFLEWVEHDLAYAVAFYESWLTDGGEGFFQRFRETVSSIEANPELFPRKHRFFRRPSFLEPISASSSPSNPT